MMNQRCGICRCHRLILPSRVTNRTINKSPFSIVYTKIPNHSIDLFDLPEPKSRNATTWATDYVKFHEEIKENIEKMNTWYKQRADMKRRKQVFQKDELVMMHLNKHRLPGGITPKLLCWRYGPFLSLGW